ncbi:hypothetical protein A3F34_00720 [Candidatus Roizmanbacteria bacterium RIFCSPHIGHO2_12_FULL_44_10]|uniref:Glycosyltransferase RgtA/B/C/D-like domain-containing protein n=1 Tax=Candidatus Roizmanbacteria bacterium RIFCSPHIGHO2_12_FULL_44_10 TaxID=1802054 RepID=A0A1F7I6Q3_9BACT|nr:MAG: hypothetical protein A3F34_00720 [Candidatus Roizmanbacteria bacterium RIFCSPHIGHO2_12_FULL_44_10]
MFNITGYINWVRRYFKKRDLLIILGLVGLFLITRLINLDKFPIFSDEGIYIRWAKVAWKDASWRFISLTDGRQPLQTWGTIAFLKLFENNALFAGRLFAVASGFFALSGIFALSAYLFNKKTAYIASLLYIITPYFLFYDRMALVDSAINGFVIWLFFFSILLARTLRLDVALLLGFLSGFALLGKSSVRLYMALMSLASLFVLYSHSEGGLIRMFLGLKHKLFGKEKKTPQLLSFFFLYGIVIAVSLLIYNVQRLSPFFHFVAEKNKTFVLTLPELIQHPWAYFPHNMVNLPYYILSEMAYVVAILGIVGLYWLYKKDKPLTIYLSLWLASATILISLVAKVLFPRYVLPLGGLLLIPAAFLLSNIKSSKRFIGLFIVIIVSGLYFNYTILFDHKNIPFPDIDRGQYLEGWPAGWGIKEIVDYSRDKSQDKPVILMAEGNFGMSGDVLDSYLKPGDKINIKGYWPLNREHLVENQALLKDNYVYLVFSHRIDFPTDWPMKLIRVFDKPGKKSQVYFFALTE